jgi:hypothetical protein
MSRCGFLTSVVLGAALAAFSGCSSPPQPDQLSAPLPDQNLAPESAKEALLEMMRSKPGKDLGWFDGNVPDEMSKMPIEEEEDGWFRWTGAFRFNTSKAIYSLEIRPRPGARVCTFIYKGSFLNKDGQWVAKAPELVMTMMPDPKKGPPP